MLLWHLHGHLHQLVDSFTVLFGHGSTALVGHLDRLLDRNLVAVGTWHLGALLVRHLVGYLTALLSRHLLALLHGGLNWDLLAVLLWH